MPKLNASTAAKVEEAEGGAFEPLPEDVYLCVLEGEVVAKEGANGPYWKWTFKVAEGSEYAGRKLFLNTSLSEKAAWRLKEVFAGFGVSADTDTDDLMGKPVRLTVVQRPIEAGTRKGEMGNDIRSVLPADSDEQAAKTGSKTGRKAEKDDVPLF